MKVIAAFGRDCGVKLEASRAADINNRATATEIRSAKARTELSNDMHSEICFIAVVAFHNPFPGNPGPNSDFFHELLRNDDARSSEGP
jgi:hypothetical protein